MVQFKLNSLETLLYYNESIWQDGIIFGFIRFGMYGHSVGAAVGLVYVTPAHGAPADAAGSLPYEIEVAGVRYPAAASLRPLYDPRNERIKC